MRSLQLCRRSSAAIHHAGELHETAWSLRTTASRVFCDVWDRRDDRAKASEAERPARPRPARFSHHRSAEGAVSGNLRSAAARRVCASTSSDADDDGRPQHDPTATVWGSAPVLAARTISAADPLHPGEWVVRELDARAVPWGVAPRCLVFENHNVVRRLWRYPSSWLTLTDGVLLGLIGVTL